MPKTINNKIKSKMIYVTVIILTLTLFVSLSKTNAYGCWGKKTKTKERFFDTTNKLIDSKRVFNEMKNAKPYKGMILCKIFDRNSVGFILRLDDDGNNLRILFQFDRYKYEDAGGITIRHCYDADYYWTTNGKIIIATYGASDWDEGGYKATGWGGPNKCYKANWDGTNFNKISHSQYMYYKNNFKEGHDTINDL